jgi:nucleoside-diphosphate-sugar epimerase
MKILITGIQGFVGRQLVHLYQDEHELFGLDQVSEDMNGVQHIFTYRELKIMPDVDVVIHAAGKSIDTMDMNKSLEYFETNVGLTRIIFDWFNQSKATMFIYFSSVKAAADIVNNTVLTEDFPPKPFGPYGESKMMAEKYVLEQWTAGKKVYVLRPAILHGCGMMGNANLEMMLKWIRKGWPYVFGKFTCRRSYTTMDNLSFVLKRMLVMDLPVGIYNVADDDTLTFLETYELLCAAMGKKPKVLHISKWILYVAAQWGSLFHCMYNKYQYEKLNNDFVVSNAKLKAALEVDAMPVNAVDGMMRSVRCMIDREKRLKPCH